MRRDRILLTSLLAGFVGVALAVASAGEAVEPCILPPGIQDFEIRSIVLPGGAKLRMVWVEGGTLEIAANPDYPRSDSWDKKYRIVDGNADDIPPGAVRRNVGGFWLGVYEVTQGQWESVMGDNPSYFRGEKLPVECVSWEDCAEFCRRTGLRLPTETEWLFAHARLWRKGMPWQFYLDWRADKSEGRTHPAVMDNWVKSWICDMDGNVSEWCADWLGEWPAMETTDYAGPSVGEERVVCGAYWCSDEQYSVYGLPFERQSLPPASRYNAVGFRVCLTPVRAPEE